MRPCAQELLGEAWPYACTQPRASTHQRNPFSQASDQIFRHWVEAESDGLCFPKVGFFNTFIQTTDEDL